ncbi:GH92 family glycosyl hydrolase [Prauserella muralis]|uniref:Alpha-1 2-mannosidase n=1 Tax=Prauserella muralis TaxID=588067 RepID=A0A2V4ASJ8_9PSEU|nr:GH92 family glycosyl hydrolase [Prauserella muralis]PXY22521.1 alpha-1 2-mannosidase [Prauserella muralis]TWE28203.1 putative alpha-1,2-mannosidase [Prauserella muralis]
MAPSEFFTSFEDGDPHPGTGQRLRVHVGDGPVDPLAALPKAGNTGARALHYATSVAGQARAGLFAVDVPVTADTELSYVVLPESDGAPPSYRSTHVTVDVEFTDGSTLSELLPPATARAQGESKRLYVDQWNLVRHRLGDVAAGRTARALVLVTDAPGEGELTGWLDDLRLGERPLPQREPVDQVRTTRGTHSGRRFSRGNCLPATAVPHGFNFWTPVTDAGALDWPYRYADRAIQAFALSHLPSPWTGDRNTFQVMPGDGAVTAGRKARARGFSHADETDAPHHYRVRLHGGITAEIAPADHAAILRFTFPDDDGWLLFDNTRNRGGLRLHPARRTVTGHTWVRSRASAGARRMFVHGTVDEQPIDGATLRRPPWRTVTGYLRFAARTVTLRLATSLLSLDQARRNLDAEVGVPLSFDDVRERARQQWAALLGRVEVDGASEDELTTLYSCLYRMYLYPNSGHEHTPGGVRHASPAVRSRRPSTRTRTGAAVREGTIAVNNGFWDTYRTTWPAYALLTPTVCGQLLDGFVRHYTEGGWIPRWSCPGAADAMVGTGSDAVFADAYLKGVRGFDVRAAYEAALRNATVTPPGRAVGRTGLGESIFLGYTPTSTREGLSWTLENCVGDFALARWARALGEDDDAEYLAGRAQRYVHLFDARIGFFQGRTRGGDWRCEPGAYDPAVWGYDYTETDGWNMAFSAPHDGEGLAALHGGRAGLESGLDTFFATPETGTRPGSYRRVIHEMTEARDVRLGQYGHANQPSHHIPYVYLHAGAPAKTQRIVREVLRRCYLGSDLGQGYPGDEDNGEMSAWYVLSALGLYPLAVGSPRYAIGSPLFRRAVVHLESGGDLVVNAPGNSERNVYVQRLWVNGSAHDVPWIDHDVLAAGAVLDFELGPRPSAWGAPAGRPRRPRPPTDLPGTARCSDGTDVARLLDDTTATEVTFSSPAPVVEHTAHGAGGAVSVYTLTSASTDGDPRDWTLEGSADGLTWTVLDRRAGETFRWRRQTRPFRVAQPRPLRHHRLRITAGTGPRVRLAQWELLA